MRVNVYNILLKHSVLPTTPFASHVITVALIALTIPIKVVVNAILHQYIIVKLVLFLEFVHAKLGGLMIYKIYFALVAIRHVQAVQDL